MNETESNIYLIENLQELNFKYRIHEVKNVSKDSDDYQKNIQFLASELTRRTDSPCINFSIGDKTYVAHPEGYGELPEFLDLVRVTAKIEKESHLRELRLDSLDPISAKLAVGFLQAAIQRKFYHSPILWQPRSGAPVFQKSPDQDFRQMSAEVDLYRGFAYRIMLLNDGRIGICVDVTSKYVSRFPLPAKISREEYLRNFRGTRCLYEYGNRWYEIRIEGLNELTADEVPIPSKGISLFEDVHRTAGIYRSQNLLALPRESSVLIYYTSWREQRNAPSGLCRLILGTNHPSIQPFHYWTIKPPFVRRKELQFAVNRYFRELSFGNTLIRLSPKPMVVAKKSLEFPDLCFGNRRVLSTRNTKDATRVTREEFPLKKREFLYSTEAGLFRKKPFDRQYLILPRSVAQSFGEEFITDVTTEVNRLFTSEESRYEPIQILYEDSVEKSVYQLGTSIIKAVEENETGSGFGIVMIPEIRSSAMMREDELGNLVMRELRKRGVFVSIIHTTVPIESYELVPEANGYGEWRVTSDRRQMSRYKGYVKNVVLNKVLILNSFWPFVLKTPTNADLTIGIDVKNHTAGFTVIHRNTEEITFYHSESSEREQLDRDHIRREILEIIRNEQKLSFEQIKHLVIHRQGKLFLGERQGINQAVERLRREGILNLDCQCTFAEIRSSFRAPFRLFEVMPQPGPGTQREWVENPPIGTCVNLSDTEAFVCTTGPPYEHQGTSLPLHVIKDGPMPIDLIVEDVFYLSNLTWTKIDDCSREPLTVKMTDIRLREFGGEYDVEALKSAEEEA